MSVQSIPSLPTQPAQQFFLGGCILNPPSDGRVTKPAMEVDATVNVKTFRGKWWNGLVYAGRTHGSHVL